MPISWRASNKLRNLLKILNESNKIDTIFIIEKNQIVDILCVMRVVIV